VASPFAEVGDGARHARHRHYAAADCRSGALRRRIDAGSLPSGPDETFARRERTLYASTHRPRDGSETHIWACLRRCERPSHYASSRWSLYQTHVWPGQMRSEPKSSSVPFSICSGSREHSSSSVQQKLIGSRCCFPCRWIETNGGWEASGHAAPCERGGTGSLSRR
jgi:hypothetical protein